MGRCNDFAFLPGGPPEISRKLRPADGESRQSQAGGQMSNARVISNHPSRLGDIPSHFAQVFKMWSFNVLPVFFFLLRENEDGLKTFFFEFRRQVKKLALRPIFSSSRTCRMHHDALNIFAFNEIFGKLDAIVFCRFLNAEFVFAKSR